MASFVSSSLKTGRLIFIWPPDSWWGHWLWCVCLEPPNLWDLDDTDEEGDAELQSLSYLHSGKGKGDRVGLPVILIAPSLKLGLAVAPNLILGTLGYGLIWAPLIMQQLLGGLLVMETDLDCWSWMVSTQVEWSEDIQALLVWCILQWWLGWSTTGLHPGLPDWHQVGLVCQPNPWLLTVWMQLLMPHPGSVLLLTTTTHKTGWPYLGLSLRLLLGQICHLRPCLPQLVPARHVEMVLLLFHLQSRSPVFRNNNMSQAGQVLVSLPETGMVNMMGATKCLWIFRAIQATWWCEGVACSLDINSRLLII